jgi:hypothetical protein
VLDLQVQTGILCSKASVSCQKNGSDEEKAEHNPSFHWYTRGCLACLLPHYSGIGVKPIDILAVHEKGLFSLGWSIATSYKGAISIGLQHPVHY